MSDLHKIILHQVDAFTSQFAKPKSISLQNQRVCLDEGFRRGREGRVYFSFLNYGHYKMFFKKLTY